MSYYWFNSNPALAGPRTNCPSQSQIEATPNLRRASLSDAVLFGGPLIRTLLQSAPIVGDHRHVFVDTKVTMLMPGWLPAIPGWHTDGVPRVSTNGDVSPTGVGKPSLPEQLLQHRNGYAPRYHTVHVGNDCATEFLDGAIALKIEHDTDEEMYSEMTRSVNATETLRTMKAPPGQWMSWDWWNIHQATQATERGWRLLIRITESDQPPSVSDFIRTQNQVYVPKEFGW